MKKILIVLFLGSGFTMIGQTKTLLSVAGEKVPYTPIPMGSSDQYIKGDHTIGDFLVTNSSTGNTANVSVNGVTSSGAPIINSISNTVNGTNLTTTVNGQASQPVDLSGVLVTSNTLTNSVNTIVSTVNGVSVSAPAVNSVENTLTGPRGTILTTIVNGEAAAAIDLGDAITGGTTITLMAINGNLVSTVNGIQSTPVVPVVVGGNNGLQVTDGIVQLGGGLGKATVISTNNTGTLAFEGLRAGTTANDILVADQNTAVLRKVPGSTFWSTKGNAGTDPLADFIGTTTQADLVLRETMNMGGG